MDIAYNIKLIFAFIALFIVGIPCGYSDVKVDGYHRKDGTYVKPHYRSDRDGLKNNNWTTQGNINPHTGEKGTLKRDYFESSQRVSALPVTNNIEQQDDCLNHNDYVCPRDASTYLDKVIDVCGFVASVREFSRGFYLNFDRPFPNQSLTGVIWTDKVQDFKNGTGIELNAIQGEFVCISGKVSIYNNRYQIIGSDGFKLL